MIVETLCSYCHHYFSRVRSSTGGGRTAKYCSPRCKQAAYRDRVTFARVITSFPVDHAESITSGHLCTNR